MLIRQVPCGDMSVNPCAAEMLISICHSFEAGIADAISSFK